MRQFWVLDDELQKIRIGRETLARLKLLAAQEGPDLSGFVRFHLEVRAWGYDAVATVYERRRGDDGTFGGCGSAGGSNAGAGLPLFQRTGHTNPLGALDDELPRMRMGSETIARLRVFAAQEGMSLSEFVRMFLEGLAFGPDVVIEATADRIRRVCGNGVQA